jgi:transketolase
MKPLHKRILDISYKLGLSHIGSNLTAVDILDKVYKDRSSGDPVILSSGHAGLALYVVLEKYEGQDAEKLLKKHGIHPNRDIQDGIYCSTGSLGHGIGIAVGMALADRTRTVHVLLSDGECAEGSVYESFNTIKEQKLGNMRVHINFNSYGAYRRIFASALLPLTQIVENACDVKIHTTKNPNVPFMTGLQAHYHVLNESEYHQLCQLYET